VVGVSGGADSLALLFLLCDLRGERARDTLHVAHLDHSFRGEEGEADARFVASFASSLGLKSTIGKEDVPAYARRCRLSPEDAARRMRYSFLAEVCSRHDDAVAVAHTADDQAETVLLALLRGAGVDGLAGMGPDRHPLLGIRRDETLGLCREEGLDPVEDSTNRDQAIRRNRVRHELLPLANAVAERDVVPLLARTAALLRADADLLAATAGALDPTDARALAGAPAAAARRAVRAWLASTTPSGEPPYPPSAAAIDRVLAVARGNATACQVAGIGRVTRSGQRLRLEPPIGRGCT